LRTDNDKKSSKNDELIEDYGYIAKDAFIRTFFNKIDEMHQDESDWNIIKKIIVDKHNNSQCYKHA
jgi:hypothetical protein